MIKASELIAYFRQALNEKWGYIWGTRGQTWTQSSQDRATRDMTVRYGQKWVGRKVADCSGLFVWAYKQKGLSIYHGSNTIWKKYCSKQGTITNGMAIKPGTAVFTVKDGVRGHIGLYIGNGLCIEAKGTQYGVVTSELSRWQEWGELKDVDYDMLAEEAKVARRTLRKGDSGPDVEELQLALNADPRYPTKVDGIFGSDTVTSVRAFQADHGLTADGIVGKKTWAKLDELEVEQDDEDKPTEEYSDIPTLTMAELTKRLIALECIVYGGDDFRLPTGGDSNGS